MSRVGQNHMYVRCIDDNLAGKSPNVRSITMYIYSYGQPYIIGDDGSIQLLHHFCFRFKTVDKPQNPEMHLVQATLLWTVHL